MPSESELDEIAELLAAEPDTDKAVESLPPESPPDTQEAAAEPAEPVESQDDADSELSADDKAQLEAFYAKKVPGTEFTYSELKDRIQDFAAVEGQREAFEEEQRTFRNERLKYAREQQMLRAAGKLPELTDEEKQQAEQQLQAYQAQQAELTRLAIPSWKSEAELVKDFEDIATNLADYGYAKDEVKQWIENDARFAKFAFDVLTERRNLAKAREKVKASNGKAKAPTKNDSPSQKQRLAAIASDPNMSKEDRGLAALLGG